MPREYEISEEQWRSARRLAEIFIRKLGKTGGFGRPRISSIHPLLDPSGEAGVFFEIKLSTSGEPDHGYLLLSISTKFPPLIKFATAGKTHVEILASKVGTDDFDALLFTPLYIVAEDRNGRRIAALGEPPFIAPRRIRGEPVRRPGPGQPHDAFKRCYLEHRPEALKRHKARIGKAWARVLRKPLRSTSTADDSDYISDSEIPDNNYEVVTAAHHESLARYRQIGPESEANDTDFASGCVAAAWMSLIGYHDNTQTLDLLRGTRMSNFIFDSPDLETDLYPSKVMMALSKYLGTHFEEKDGVSGGSVHSEDIDKAYSFIRGYLGHEVAEEQYFDGGEMQSLQLVYDYLCKYGVPSVITIDYHAMVAWEVWANRDDDDEEHYLRFYDGQGNTDPDTDPLIPFEVLNGAWTLARIVTRTHVVLPWQSYKPPAMVQAGEELVIAFRGLDKRIYVASGPDGDSFTIRATIDSTGTEPPSLAADDRCRLYLAWADGASVEYPLQLAVFDYVNWGAPKFLPTPRHVAEDAADMPPCIALWGGYLYFVWRSRVTYGCVNFARCGVQGFDESALPWPSAAGGSLETPYWTAFWKVVPLVTEPQLSLTSDADYFYLGYRRPGDWWEKQDFNAILDRDGGFASPHPEGPHPKAVIEHPSGRRIEYFNHVLYATSSGPISEVVRELTSFYDDVAQYVRTEYRLRVTETYWPQDLTSDAVVLGSFDGLNMGPCLVSAWLSTEGVLCLRYHSVDNGKARLDYSGWPLANAAWPNDLF